LEEDDHQDVSQMQDSHDPEPSGTGDDDGLIIDWRKERAAKELVGSIQRRVMRTDHEEIKVSRARNKVIRKSRSFDDKLAKLVPEVESLPRESLNAWSLDRNRMKQSLPFELLANMCPPMGSVGDAFPAALSAAILRSSDGPKAACSPLGYRKMSAPVGSEFLPFHRQDSNSAREEQDELEDGAKGSLDTVAGDDMETFKDECKAAQSQFRARSRAFRLRDGERRHRRLTEPILYTQDYSRSDHM